MYFKFLTRILFLSIVFLSGCKENLYVYQQPIVRGNSDRFLQIPISDLAGSYKIKSSINSISNDGTLTIQADENSKLFTGLIQLGPEGGPVGQEKMLFFNQAFREVVDGNSRMFLELYDNPYWLKGRRYSLVEVHLLSSGRIVLWPARFDMEELSQWDTEFTVRELKGPFRENKRIVDIKNGSKRYFNHSYQILSLLKGDVNSLELGSEDGESLTPLINYLNAKYRVPIYNVSCKDLLRRNVVDLQAFKVENAE